MFKLTHDFQSHDDFHKIYKRIIENYYIKHLIRRLKRYILHCSQC